MSPASQQLQSRVAAVRGWVARRAGGVVAVWVAGGIASLLVVAWVLAGPRGFVQGSDTPAVLDVLAVALVVVGWFGLRRWLGQLSEARLASNMEESAGLRSGLVEGALELSRTLPDGVSSALAGRAVFGVVRDLDGRSEEQLAGRIADSARIWSLRGLGFLSVVTVVLGGLTAISPARTGHALRGVASPIATLRDPVLPPLVVQPGNIEVLRGTDVELEISAAGRQSIDVAWQAAGDIARSESLAVVEGRARHTFRTVSANIEYRVLDEAGNASPTYRIVPVDPLFVSDMVLSVAYPPHTGIPADEYRGDPPPLRLPAGSTVVFEGLTSRPLSSVQLVDSTGAQVLSFEIDRANFRAQWAPAVSGSLEWVFRDEMGGAAEIQPEPLDVTVVPDAAPVIRIPVPGRDTIMPLNFRQPLLLESGDDYGLRRVELVAYRVTSFGERMEPVAQGFDAGGQRAIMARPLLDLRNWGLLPGDTVRYYARATDNSPAGQVTVSDEYVLRMPDAAELRREAEDAFEDVANRLEELAAEAERQATENREQALESAAQRGMEEGREEEEAQFQQREELEAALDEQRQMNAAVDSMRQEMEALEQMMEEAGQADPELRRQLEELQEMLQQMTGDELQRRMEEMAEALEQENMADANQALEEMAGEQEELRDRLEEALERFKRAALEQDFRATTSEVEELARQEQALADAMKEGDDPELRAQQQQDLARQAEALEENMASLEERLAEMGEQEASQGVQEARERSAEGRERMQEAQQQAEQGDSRQAGEEAQQAADEMQEAAQEMQQAMAEMAQQQMEKIQRAMMQTADDALSLARRQNELNERMQGANQDQLAGMRAEQASMLQGVENIAENLQLATEGAMGENRELSAQMGLAMESLQNTIEAMEGRRGGTPSATAQAEQAIGDLNQLALMAIANAEQMGQQGQGQGGEEVSEQLEQLAQQQGDIMNQSTQLMPMQLGEQAMQQQMQQMSEGQQSVASDLGDLADEPGAEESLGDLQQLAQEAQAIAEEMAAQGRLTPEMIQRQERLFHRLLDAGRSLEREEFSEERESEQPEEFERGRVMSLTADQMGIMRYEIPDGAQLQQLSPAVRQLVLQYFERLNRARPGGGS
ncbi:MAG: hypothetical protein ACPHWZ_11235 [Longimicrobiales bacterium]